LIMLFIIVATIRLASFLINPSTVKSVQKKKH
jgi:hypothetical protein